MSTVEIGSPERRPARPPLVSRLLPTAPLRRGLVAIVALIVVLVALAVVRLATLKVPDVAVHSIATTSVRLAGAAPVPSWPAAGQAAVTVEGIGSLGSAGGDTPRPIASLTKVMTAYLVLRRYPLSTTGDGFAITVTQADVQAEHDDAAQDQSVVPVAAGERLSERQLLEALLIPSGDNIARMLGTYASGSVAQFVTEMNSEAHKLGMSATTYTDPSGYEPSTVSDASDQLRIFERAIRNPVFRQIVSMPSATLPVAGTVQNYDPLIAEGYGGKTGSDSEAEGCLAFFKYVTVGGRRLTVVGVVLGQGEGSATSVILGAAGDAAQDLVSSVTPAVRTFTVLSAGTPLLTATSASDASVRALTVASLRVIGWGGLRERLAIKTRSAGTDLRAGAVLGTASLSGSLLTPVGSDHRTVARTARALVAPGLSWRLSHLL